MPRKRKLPNNIKKQSNKKIKTNTLGKKRFTKHFKNALDQLDEQGDEIFNESYQQEIISNTQFNRSQINYKQELQQLEESYIPKELLFRKQEEKKIKQFIKAGIQNEGSQSCLYITGIPGLGKTACLLKVVKEILQENSIIDYYYINALKLRTPNTFYSILWQKMTGVNFITPQKSNQLLEHLFKFGKLPGKTSQYKDQKFNRIKILVIDEIDFLYTKNQNVFYNIFDWQHFPHSNLIVIAIANTLDFPDIILTKIQSRMGRQNLIFKTYTHQEIAEILKNRLNQSSLFTEKSIDFIAKKTANFSSDIRKSLHICRNAIHEVIKLNQKAKPNQQIKKIDINFMIQIFEKEFSKPITFYVRNCSQIHKIFLIACLYELIEQNKIIDVNKLFRRLNGLLGTMQKSQLDFYQFQRLVQYFTDLKVINFDFNLQFRTKINLNFEAEDISYGLQNDQLFIEFGHLSRLLTNQLIINDNQNPNFIFNNRQNLTLCYQRFYLQKLEQQSVIFRRELEDLSQWIFGNKNRLKWLFLF